MPKKSVNEQVIKCEYCRQFFDRRGLARHQMSKTCNKERQRLIQLKKQHQLLRKFQHVCQCGYTTYYKYRMNAHKNTRCKYTNLEINNGDVHYKEIEKTLSELEAKLDINKEEAYGINSTDVLDNLDKQIYSDRTAQEIQNIPEFFNALNELEKELRDRHIINAIGGVPHYLKYVFVRRDLDMSFENDEQILSD
jgi:hypothetical protein